MADAAQAVEVEAAPQGQPAETAAQAPTQGTQDVAAQTTQTAPVGEAANTPPTETKPAETKQNWADNWRQLLVEGVGGDEKILKRLDRFTTPADVLKSWLAAEKKISSGEYKKALGKDATPEEVAAWKQENGIPDKPHEYIADMQGLVIGEDDKPGVDSMLEFAAQNSIPKSYVQGMVKWYDGWKDQQAQAMAEADAQYGKESEDKLRQDWGGEYRMNQNAVKTFALQAFGEELANDIFQARLPDGTLFGNNPALNMAFASLARELNPAATVVPAGVTANAGGIAAEITRLESLMGDRDSEYWKGPKAAKNQEDYRKYTDALARMK